MNNPMHTIFTLFSQSFPKPDATRRRVFVTSCFHDLTKALLVQGSQMMKVIDRDARLSALFSL